MVCATAILSSSLALSLLREAAPPSKSFVLSPFSLNTALSILHDGADGWTQIELTDLLLKGCSSSDVTQHYSSLALSLPSTNETGVAFKTANRFYVDQSISLKADYQKHIADEYSAKEIFTLKLENLELSNKVDAARTMNKFVEDTTNGKIKDVIKPDGISDTAKAIFINAVHFLGKWQSPFSYHSTRNGTFKGVQGARSVAFMNKYHKTFLVNTNNDLGTVLILPYQNKNFSFFYLMPKESSDLEKMRNELTGERLINVLKGANSSVVNIAVPKFKIESKLDAEDALLMLGVKNLFNEGADFSKITSAHIEVSKITHNAVIETDELGTAAAAATVIEMVAKSGFTGKVQSIVIDRPFLFGIVKNDDILFIGQYFRKKYFNNVCGLENGKLVCRNVCPEGKREAVQAVEKREAGNNACSNNVCAIENGKLVCRNVCK